MFKPKCCPKPRVSMYVLGFIGGSFLLLQSCFTFYIVLGLNTTSSNKGLFGCHTTSSNKGLPYSPKELIHANLTQRHSKSNARLLWQATHGEPNMPKIPHPSINHRPPAPIPFFHTLAFTAPSLSVRNWSSSPWICLPYPELVFLMPRLLLYPEPSPFVLMSKEDHVMPCPCSRRRPSLLASSSYNICSL